MIQKFQKVELPKVNLGNLGLHNACSYYVDKDSKNYPIAFFGKQNKEGPTMTCFPEKPEECPKGYKVYEQFDTPLERLLDYARGLEEEHSDLTNEQINHPADFIGSKRCARWEDERRRRGLID